MGKPNRSSARSQALSQGVNPRPRVRGRMATGRSRLHYIKSTPSDPVRAPETPTDDKADGGAS